MTPHEIEAIKATITEADLNYPKAKELKADPMAIASLAQCAGLTVLYNVIYRPISGDAAHTSIDSLDRHIQADVNGEIEGLKFGPEVNDLPQTLSDAILVFMHALYAALELFPSPKFSDDLEKCVEPWKTLILSTKNNTQ
jgi:hypothetical protein